MRNILALLISIIFVSCSNDKDISKYFKILPSLQEIKFDNGYSDLNFKNINYAYSENNIQLPIRYHFTNHIQTNNFSDAVINYSINPALDLIDEGYELNITKNKISFVAKDEKGLFYAFVTLDLLIEDSKDQNINLPLVSIKDFPSLKFRPIHIDIKHHMEKKSYYFNLIDDLAKQKINGIIVEFEDKLKYELRPEVGASDALPIKWWIEKVQFTI